MVSERWVWLQGILTFCFISFSGDYKPKKIKTEDDRSEKKAKKRKQEEEVNRWSYWLISLVYTFQSVSNFDCLFIFWFSIGHKAQKEDKGQERRSRHRWQEKGKKGARREVEMVSLTSSDGQVIVGWLLVLSLFWFYSGIWCRSQMSLFRHFADPFWLPASGCWFTSFPLCAFSYHLGGRKKGTQMEWNGSF